jgi:pyruvate kinase
MTADPGSGWRRRTKLVCTLGPATQDRIEELVGAGMDVARLNFSHGERTFLATSAARVRDVAHAAGRPVGILADLSGWASSRAGR